MPQDVYLDAAHFLTRVVPRGADEAQRLCHIIKILEGHGTRGSTTGGTGTGTNGSVRDLLSA